MKSVPYVGKQPLHTKHAAVQGESVTIGGEALYRIANYDRLRPFFMSLVSSSDHWLFISSTGALTAGRRNPDLALFPYYTDDKIHDSAEITGSRTLLLVDSHGRNCLWEPFSERFAGIYRVRRNLYKNYCGNKLIFEEVNEDLNLSFRYGWCPSERFGFVRKASLGNLGKRSARVRLLDGLQNLMPWGAGSQFQLEKSTLLDAYKRNELVPETGLGLFRLSAIPIDRPVPAEALRVTTVWSVGLGRSRKLLSCRQLNRFREGLPLEQEVDIRAERGAYLLERELSLSAGQTWDWWIVADVNRGPSEVAELNRLLKGQSETLTGGRRARRITLPRMLEEDIDRGTQELRRLVASADGMQKTAQPLGNARHFANVLFNIMRGGIFVDDYQVDPADLSAFVRQANQRVAARQSAFFRKLTRLSDRGPRDRSQAPTESRGVHHAKLLEFAVKTGDANLERLCREYLPLTFSRRHGDPSRPWNRFSIASRDWDGKPVLQYEGNWRDIFQNWEALALSFPGYTSSMVCRFVNASTADGYNPYRITQAGIDWEVPVPHDPWSHIGYWGDHQVIYLLKLLEIFQRHEPLTLRGFLTREIFSYAQVPYRIKPYDQLLADPKQTVVFDSDAEQLVRRRVQVKGADGKLVWGRSGDEVYLVNLTEKLLVLVLAKFANFIPGAGIWLNTQRPEWNDANNALVGNGVSMVTLYYLRRYLAFCGEIFAPLEPAEMRISEEVSELLLAMSRALQHHLPLLPSLPSTTGSSKSSNARPPLSDSNRKRVLDDLGRAGSQYRQRIYAQGFSGRRTSLQVCRLLSFLDLALAFIDDSIAANRRPDGLYHAYNLVDLGHRNQIPIRRLYEMLEGQVAVLSSGRLSPADSLSLLSELKHSQMYRSDQHSYLLYPNRQLPRFLDRNTIPAKELAQSRLLLELVEAGDRRLVERDVNGRVHFVGCVTNAADVSRILVELAGTVWAPLVKRESPLVLAIFERLFDHQSFTGRSGTFFGYEGLGCIYWHMVSKLLLATQETYFRAAAAGAPAATLQQLAECYYDIRAGIGDKKSPEVYGAFPMDPYSHTPGHAGARQPGLTGQVKEDILCRFGELGVFIDHGQICFRPLLLRCEEFLPAPADFQYVDLAGRPRRWRLPAGSLAFTYCQVPIRYQLDSDNALSVVFDDQSKLQSPELRLDVEISRSIFLRQGRVRRIVVRLRSQ